MHTSPITSVAYGKDGSLLSAGYDGKLIRWTEDLSKPNWETKSNALVNSLRAYTDLVISVGANRKLCFNDYETGVEQDQAEKFTCGDDLNAVCVAPTNRKILVAGEEAIVYCVDMHGNLDWSYKSCDLDGTPADCIDTLSIFNYKGEEVIAFGDDRGVFTVLSIRRSGAVICVRKIQAKIESISSQSSSNKILLGLDSGRIAIITMEDDQSLSEIVLEVHTSTVKAVALLGEKQIAVSASYDGYLSFLDISNYHILSKVRIDGEGVNAWARSLAVSPLDENILAISSLGCRPLVIDVGATIREKKIISRFELQPGLTHGLNCTAVSKNAVYAAGDDGSIYQFDEFQTIKTASLGVMINEIAVTKDGGALYAATQDGSLVAIDVNSCSVLWVRNIFDCPSTTLAIISDSIIAIGSYGGLVSFASMGSGELMFDVQCKDTIKSISSLGPSLVAVGDADGHLYTIDIATSQIRDQVGGCYLINSLSWCDSKRKIASVGRDCKLRIWNDRLECLEIRSIHEKSVKSVKWSPDGATILTGGYDGKIGIHAENKSNYFLVHSQPGVSSVDWDSQGRPVSAGWDGHVIIWDLEGRVVEDYAV